MKRILFYTLITPLLFLMSCGGDDEPTSGDPLDFPESCENYSFNITSGTISFQFSAPNFVSPDAQFRAENFFFKAVPLDSNFVATIETLRAIDYSFFDGNGNTIKESKELPSVTIPEFELWDVKVNNEPFYGKFSYTIELTYDSGTISGEGEAFAVSCALIDKCCDENDPNCEMFFDGDNCAWGSNVRLGNQQSNFAIECCQ